MWGLGEVKEWKPKPEVLSFFPELAVRLDGESLNEWSNRSHALKGRDPVYNDWCMAPFPKVIMPACRDARKYIWCIQNFGMVNFMDVVSEGYAPNATKVWLFNKDIDAVTFKLTWVGADQAEG